MSIKKTSVQLSHSGLVVECWLMNHKVTVLFPVREHALVAGWIPPVGVMQETANIWFFPMINASISPSVSFHSEINKIILRKKETWIQSSRSAMGRVERYWSWTRHKHLFLLRRSFVFFALLKWNTMMGHDGAPGPYIPHSSFLLGTGNRLGLLVSGKNSVVNQ